MLKLTNCLIDECDNYFVAGNALARKVVPVVVVQRVGLWRDPEVDIHLEGRRGLGWGEGTGVCEGGGLGLIGVDHNPPVARVSATGYAV